MKKITLILIDCIMSTSFLLAQQSDEELVKKTVSYYLDGGTNNDFETIKKAFHKDARMKYIKNGSYQEVNAIDFFKRVIKPDPKQNRETSIASISVSGNAANAVLKIKYSSFSFTDYMSLLKINGEWKVVSKIFFRDKK